jgi:hypothetical protein
MNKLEGGQGLPNNPESTRQRDTDPREAGKGVPGPARQSEQAQPQKRSAEGNPLLSPGEQKRFDNSSTTPEKEAKEAKFEITEREKYLLEIMAHVIAQSYIPKFGSAIRQEHMEKNLLSHINKITKIVPS